MHQRGVDADGGIVEEQPLPHGGDVHAPLRAGDERLDRGGRVGAVQPEVTSEVVAGAGRDAHEGQLGLDRHRGDRRQRAVPARHTEHVRAIGDRLAGDREELGGSRGLMYLDAVPVGGLQELIADRLDAPGTRVEDQHRPLKAVDLRRHLAPGRRDLGRLAAADDHIDGLRAERPAGRGHEHRQQQHAGE